MSTSGRFAVARLGTSPVEDTNAPKGAPCKGLQEWTVEEDTDELDASDGEGLATNTDSGMPGIRVTLRVVQKSSTGPPINYRPGTILSQFKLYYTRIGVIGSISAAYHLPFAIVLKQTNQVRVRGQKECTLVIKNKGTYFGPGDIDPGSGYIDPDV